MVRYLYGQIESLTDQLPLNYTDAPFLPAVRALRSQPLFERPIANHFYKKKSVIVRVSRSQAGVLTDGGFVRHDCNLSAVGVAIDFFKRRLRIDRHHAIRCFRIR